MQSETDITNDIKENVKLNLKAYSTRLKLANLTPRTKIIVRYLVYRNITVFVSALAIKYKILSNSFFDMIEQMAAKNKITFNTAEKLKCAVAIACEIRLKASMEKQSDCDDVDLEHRENNTTLGIEKFLNIVGLASTINFFQIAYCLQCEVAKQFNISEHHFYSDYILINIRIGLTFGLLNVASCLVEDRQKRSWDMSDFNFDECIEELESDFGVCSETLENFGKILFTPIFAVFNNIATISSTKNELQHKLELKQLLSIANYLKSIGLFDEALEFYLHILAKINTADNDVAFVNHAIGCCYLSLLQPRDALRYLLQALEIKEKLTQNADMNIVLQQHFMKLVALTLTCLTTKKR